MDCSLARKTIFIDSMVVPVPCIRALHGKRPRERIAASERRQMQSPLETNLRRDSALIHPACPFKIERLWRSRSGVGGPTPV